MIRHPPNSPLFPNPPLFRSGRDPFRRNEIRVLGGEGHHLPRHERTQPFEELLDVVRDVVMHQRFFPMISRWIWLVPPPIDRKSTRLNSSHLVISYAVFCLKK